MHNAWDLGDSGIENVDNCLVIRTEDDVLPRPLVAQNVCGNRIREDILIKNSLIHLRRIPRTIKPFSFEISTAANRTGCIRGPEVTSKSEAANMPEKSQKLTPFHVMRN